MLRSSVYFSSVPVSTLSRRESGLVVGAHVGDVVPGVAVEGLLHALLVEVVAHQPDGAAQHEQRVDAAHADVAVAFLSVNQIINQ